MYFLVGRSSGSEVFCLDKYKGKWSVFYTERGRKSPPIFTSESLEEASEFFYTFMTEHWYLVASLKNESEIDMLRKQLENYGIKSLRNDFMTEEYSGLGNSRYEILVTEKQICKVRKLLGKVPILEDGDDEKQWHHDGVSFTYFA